MSWYVLSACLSPIVKLMRRSRTNTKDHISAVPEEILTITLAYAVAPDHNERCGYPGQEDKEPKNSGLTIRIRHLSHTSHLFNRLALSYFDNIEHTVTLYALSNNSWRGETLICATNFDDPFLLVCNIKRLGIEIAATDLDMLGLFMNEVSDVVLAGHPLKQFTFYLDGIEEAWLPLIKRQMDDILEEKAKRNGQEVRLAFVGEPKKAKMVWLPDDVTVVGDVST